MRGSIMGRVGGWADPQYAGLSYHINGSRDKSFRYQYAQKLVMLRCTFGRHPARSLPGADGWFSSCSLCCPSGKSGLGDMPRTWQAILVRTACGIMSVLRKVRIRKGDKYMSKYRIRGKGNM